MCPGGGGGGGAPPQRPRLPVQQTAQGTALQQGPRSERGSDRTLCEGPRCGGPVRLPVVGKEACGRPGAERDRWSGTVSVGVQPPEYTGRLVGAETAARGAGEGFANVERNPRDLKI